MTMEIVSPLKDAIDVIKEAKGDSFKYCYQCGMCDTVCPWNRVTIFSMRNIVRQATFGLPDFETEDLWRCTTCGRCQKMCPRGVDTIKVTTSLRRIASEAGIFPGPLHRVKTSLAAEGNPLGEARSKRADWAEGHDVKTFTENMEILYFPGCYGSYEPRLRKVSLATVDILNKAGVSWGILGTQESCCGEAIRKTGDEDLFKHLAKQNIKTFIDAGVKRILVSSPHCYHSFKNEYPDFKVNFEVVHISQYIAELVKSGRLKLTKGLAKRVTYHDPCYLGRHNGVYDEPRDVLKQIPGLELVEMLDARKDSLCCGGGGGRIWEETPRAERFSDIRVKQALDVKAKTLVTSCPYCITNFEDSRMNLPDSEVIEVKDITEMVQEAL